MLARCFLSGLPTIASSGMLFPSIDVAEAPGIGWPTAEVESGGALSPNGPVLGDFLLDMLALSGSADSCLFSYRRKSANMKICCS